MNSLICSMEVFPSFSLSSLESFSMRVFSIIFSRSLPWWSPGTITVYVLDFARTASIAPPMKWGFSFVSTPIATLRGVLRIQLRFPFMKKAPWGTDSPDGPLLLS